MSPKDKESRLLKYLEQFSSSIVAFSGGVDSSYLAFMADRVMGAEARIVTALSPSVSRMQENLVKEFVSTYKLNHHFVHTDEMEDPHYTSNPTNRCYFCKTELYNALLKLKREWNVEVVFDGSNADDVSDYRPGRTAAHEASIKSPLIEAGIRKEDLRLLSRDWGLPTWNLPAMPCLSSRLPYGVEVTPERLEQIEEAESFIRSLGFKDFRVRHHDDLARIEIAQAELAKIMDLGLFKTINEQLKSLGYQYVTIDLQGFRSGSLNELLDLQL
jgi:uncharacterized protein